VCPISTRNAGESFLKPHSSDPHRFVRYAVANPTINHITQWSACAQQRQNNRISLELDYIGSLGRKLGIFVDPNQPNVIVRDSTKRGTATPNEQVFPYNHYGSFSDSYGRAAVNSNYSGAVAVVKYRGVHGMAAQGSYTWSHSLDYGSAFFGSTGDFGYPSNGNNLRAEYGNSAFDMRHRFVGFYSFPLPFGPGQMFWRRGTSSRVRRSKAGCCRALPKFSQGPLYSLFGRYRLQRFQPVCRSSKCRYWKADAA
jgi:hypothetical protein